MKRLQYLLIHSYYAKVLAVRKVTTNKGKNTPGVDKQLWKTPAAKMRGALTLTDKGYKAKPLRRVYIEKPGKKKKRPLGIPCMYDRAMQALYALALDPVSETTADTKSFGFRKGRCAQDACEYIFTALSRGFSPEWVLEGDIKGCFDHISHQWLIDHILMDKSVLKQFLKAGFVFQGELFPTDEGTPQGGIISPILANMALDGLQQVLSNRFDLSRKGKYSAFVHNKSQQLLNIAYFPIIRHTKVRMDANPYFDTQYFIDRKFQRGMKYLSGRFKTVWKEQNGCCFHCGLPMDIGEDKEIFYKTPINMGGTDDVKNMAYIHKHCQQIFLERRAKA